MILVMLVMLVMTLLAVVALAAATQLAGNSNHDVNSKQALEAAEAGLRTATYRLSMLQPADGMCVTGVVVSPTGGWCGPDGPEALGNGGTFTFWTSSALALGTCAGLALQNQIALSQRCVTAIGTVNGVSRRLQTRLAAFVATPLYPLPGVIGLQSVTVAPNAHLTASVGTDGTISFGNNASASATLLGPAATLTPNVNASPGPVTTRTAAQGPYVLANVNPGNSAAVNDNGRISSGLDVSVKTTYTPSTRALSLGNGGAITLGGGLYNFCSLTAANNTTIALAAGVKAQIFIDSPDDPNSGCPAGSGTLTMSNGASFVNSSQDPTALQIYVYGSNSNTNVVTLANNTAFYGSVYAPHSTIQLSNTANFYGAVAGNVVSINNVTNVFWDARAGTLQASTMALYYRTAWHECPLQPTSPSDPGSGC
jgi:Tfp pilus assembly protein FimT